MGDILYTTASEYNGDMTEPLLIILHGPGSGTRFDLGSEGHFTIDKGCPPRRIVSDKAEFSILSESSRRILQVHSDLPFTVNGNATKSHTLQHGDLLETQAIRMMYDDGAETESSPKNQTSSDLWTDETSSGIEGRGRPVEIHRRLVDDLHQTQNDLALLYRITTELTHIIDADKLLRNVLRIVMDELTHAEHGYVLLRGGPEKKLRIIAYRDQNSKETRIRGPYPRISSTVTEEVLRSGESILFQNMQRDERFQHRESVRLGKIQSVIAAPLIANDQVEGVLLCNTSRISHMFGQHDLERVSAVGVQTGVLYEKILLQSQAMEKRRIDQEIQNALSIQQFLLPRKTPNLLGIELGSERCSTNTLGGDYHDTFPISSFQTVILVADVAGHHLSSALVMAMFRSLIHAYSNNLDDPAEILNSTHKALHEGTPPGMFVTCFLGILDSRHMTLQYANAGHPYPVLIQEDSQCQILGQNGFPVGLRSASTYETESVDITPGSKLLLYTDGLVESKNMGGAAYGREKLIHCLKHSKKDTATELARRVLSSLRNHRGSNSFDDDVTILSARVLPDLKTWYRTIPSRSELLGPISQEVTDQAKKFGFADKSEGSFRLLIRELLANAIVHGNQENPIRRVQLLLRASGDSLEIVVSDRGRGFDVSNTLRETQQIDLKKRRGRGLLLIQEYSQSVRFNERGNEVTVTVKQPG